MRPGLRTLLLSGLAPDTLRASVWLFPCLGGPILDLLHEGSYSFGSIRGALVSETPVSWNPAVAHLNLEVSRNALYWAGVSLSPACLKHPLAQHLDETVSQAALHCYIFFAEAPPPSKQKTLRVQVPTWKIST